jgi:tetratricopeptide (TPR) repeat protein
MIVAITIAGTLLGSGLSIRAQEPENAALHLRVAQKAIEDNNFDIALSEVRIAATLAPTDPIIHFALATILDKTDNVEEALAALDKAQSLNLPDALREKATDLRVTLLYKQQKAKQEKTAQEKKPLQRFEVRCEGCAVLDSLTGLEWAGRDNGPFMSWRAASQYCAGLVLEDRSDWRLPASEEMSALYAAVLGNAAIILPGGYSVRPVPGVSMSGAFFWTSEGPGTFFNFSAVALASTDNLPVTTWCVRRANDSVGVRP